MFLIINIEFIIILLKIIYKKVIQIINWQREIVNLDHEILPKVMILRMCKFETDCLILQNCPNVTDTVMQT